MTCRRAVRHSAPIAPDGARAVVRPPDHDTEVAREILPSLPDRDAGAACETRGKPDAQDGGSATMRAGAMFALCQAGWLLCVLGAARHAALPGIGFAAGMVAGCLVSHARPARAAGLVISVTAIGWLWDSLITRTGLLVYVDGALPATAAPGWMAALWALFAIQLDGPFRWLRNHPWRAAAIGALAGPLSFRAGAALGAARLVDAHAALLTIGLGWMLLLPGCLTLARHWLPSADAARDA